MKEWSPQEAKKGFSDLVNAALSGYPQFINTPGQRAVVMISAYEYNRLRQLEASQIPSVSQLLLEIPQDDQEFDRQSITLRELNE